MSQSNILLYFLPFISCIILLGLNPSWSTLTWIKKPIEQRNIHTKKVKQLVPCKVWNQPKPISTTGCQFTLHTNYPQPWLRAAFTRRSKEKVEGQQDCCDENKVASLYFLECFITWPPQLCRRHLWISIRKKENALQTGHAKIQTVNNGQQKILPLVTCQLVSLVSPRSHSGAWNTSIHASRWDPVGPRPPPRRLCNLLRVWLCRAGQTGLLRPGRRRRGAEVRWHLQKQRSPRTARWPALHISPDCVRCRAPGKISIEWHRV